MIPYDHSWREEQSGKRDNWWWYLFNMQQRLGDVKYTAEQMEIIAELRRELS